MLSLIPDIPNNYDPHAWFNFIPSFPLARNRRCNGLNLDLAEALADVEQVHQNFGGKVDIGGGGR